MPPLPGGMIFNVHSIHYMNFFTKLALGTALAAAAIVPTAANAEPLCLTQGGASVCMEAYGSYDRVAYEGPEGWALFDVTCTDDSWILHTGGRQELVGGQATAERMANDYCDGRGSMF